MDKGKLGRVIEKLEEQALDRGYTRKFTVKGVSMKYLLLPGDRIAVKKIPQHKLKTGDIIVFRREDKLLAHRIKGSIMHRGESYYRTAGDYNFKSDLFLVAREAVLGRVEWIERKEKKVILEGFPGRIRSGMIRFCSMILLRADYLLKFAVRFPEIFYRIAGPEYCSSEKIMPDWDSYSKTADYEKSAKNAAVICGFAEKYDIGRKGVIADIGFGYGLSEEAFSLSKRGLEVTSVEIESFGSGEKFPAILISGILSLISDENTRKEFLEKLIDTVRPGGYVLFSGIEMQKVSFPAVMIWVKRKFWSLIARNSRRRPAYGDTLINGDFVFHRFSSAQLAAELSSSALEILEKTNEKHQYNIIARVKCAA
ncbi:MAG: S24/S26 family peptidase [Elusimicrobiota bacterium]